MRKLITCFRSRPEVLERRPLEPPALPLRCRERHDRGRWAPYHWMWPLPTSAVLGQSKDFRSIPQRFASFYFACSTDAPSIPASCAGIALGTFGILLRSTLVRRFGRLNLDR